MFNILKIFKSNRAKLDEAIIGKIEEIYRALTENKTYILTEFNLLKEDINNVKCRQIDTTEYCNHTHQNRKRLQRLEEVFAKLSGQVSYLLDEIRLLDDKINKLEKK